MQINETESWVDIKGYEGLYQVSNLGRVRSIKRSKILSPCKNSLGYRTVSLCNNGSKKTISVHVLVWRMFKGFEVIKGFDVDHIDNDKGNNRLDNLQYITHKENSLKNPAKNVRRRRDGSEMAGSFHKASQKWTAFIRINGKMKYLGLFLTREQANEAYQKALINSSLTYYA